MVAFTVFGWPIYRYGILYLLSFSLAYAYFSWICKWVWLSAYPKIQKLLQYHLDDLMIFLILWVLLWGRLGDVFLYNRSYYSHHLIEIVQIRNGGMSFVWGFIGVGFAMLFIKKSKDLETEDLFVLFDVIVLFLPLAILFGRIGNALNQELYGKMVTLSGFSDTALVYLHKLKLIRIYDMIDNQYRRNTNLLEGFFEGFLVGMVQIIAHIKLLGKKIWLAAYRPGIVTGRFCILYGFIRFFLETLRDNPSSEYMWWILKSQLLMVVMIFVGIIILWQSTSAFRKFDKTK